MPVVSPLRQSAITQGDTTKPDTYFSAIGPEALDGFQPLNDQILVATYMRPQKTAGGILLADRAHDEDRFQGRAGLLLKCGPDAFEVDSRGFKWVGDKPKPGDWVVFHYSDAREILLNQVSCRTLRASAVQAVVADPRSIF